MTPEDFDPKTAETLFYLLVLSVLANFIALGMIVGILMDRAW